MLLIPLAIAITLLQWLLYRGIDLLGVVTGQGAGVFAVLALVIGTTLTLLGLGLVQAATACALVEIDAGRPIGPVRRLPDRVSADPPAAADDRALRRRLGRPHGDRVPDSRRASGSPCAGASSRPSSSSRIVRALRLSGAAPASSGGAGSGSARSSASAPAIALVAGPLLGVALIFLTDMPFALLNVVAGVVYSLSLPFVALVTAYVYFDARTRGELEPADDRAELPAEIELRTS